MSAINSIRMMFDFGHVLLQSIDKEGTVEIEVRDFFLARKVGQSPKY